MLIARMSFASVTDILRAIDTSEEVHMILSKTEGNSIVFQTRKNVRAVMRGCLYAVFESFAKCVRPYFDSREVLSSFSGGSIRGHIRGHIGVHIRGYHTVRETGQ